MLRTRMESLFSEVDKMMPDMFKASGINPIDLMSEMDEETGSILISTCKMYKEAKDLSLETADMMDRQSLQMEQLMKMNEKLIEKVENLHDEQEILIEMIKQQKEQGNTCECKKK